MTLQVALSRLALFIVLATFAASPAASQGEVLSFRPSVELAGGVGTAGLGGRVGLGVSDGRTALQVYLAGTLDGLVLADGDSARSASVGGLMFKYQLSPADAPFATTLGAGFGVGHTNDFVEIIDPEEVAERLGRGRTLTINSAGRGLYIPVEATATYWIHGAVGVSAGGYVGVPMFSIQGRSYETDRVTSPWQWATLAGIRIGRPTY